MIVTGLLTLFLLTLCFKYFCEKLRVLYLLSKIPWSDHRYKPKDFYTLLNGNAKNIFEYMSEGIKISKPTSKLFLGFNWAVIVQNPEDLRIIFNSKNCLDKGSTHQVFDLDQGLVFGTLEAWYRHRNVLEPFFNSLSIKKNFSMFNEKCAKLIQNLKMKENEREFDIFNDLAALTLESIMHKMNFEVDIQSLTEEKKNLMLKSLDEIMEIMGSRSLKFWLRPNFIFERTKLYKRYKELYYASPNKFALKIIEKHKRNHELNEKPKSIVDALMDQENNLTDKEIYDEIKTLFLAGLDTTAITIASTLLLLAMHKDIQCKLFDEIKKFLPSKDDDVTVEVLDRLPYVDQILNESMRLFPVGLFGTRYTDNEVQLSNFKVPKGVEIVYPIYKVHRNPLLWGDDAHLFKPERFDEENIRKIHPYAFIPFTKGPRICLGWRYAICLMKICLIRLLRNFEFDTSLELNKVDFKFCVTMKICQGYQVKISKRKP